MSGRFLRIIAVLVVLMLSISIVVVRKFGPFVQYSWSFSTRFPAQALIAYPSKYNYRQTINDCAPFSAAAVIRIAKKEPVGSATIVQQTHWRLPNKHTPPWSLEAVIRNNRIGARGEVFGHMSDSDRIVWILSHLS